MRLLHCFTVAAVSSATATTVVAYFVSPSSLPISRDSKSPNPVTRQRQRLFLRRDASQLSGHILSSSWPKSPAAPSDDTTSSDVSRLLLASSSSRLHLANSSGENSNIRNDHETRNDEDATGCFDTKGFIEESDNTPTQDSIDYDGDYMDECDDEDSPDEAKVGGDGVWNTLARSLDECRTNLSKKQVALEKELEKVKSLESVLHRANLLLSNLHSLPPGTERASVQDWEQNEQVELVVNLEKYTSAQEEAQALFATAKKIKKGSAVIENLLKDVKYGTDILNIAQRDLDEALALNDEAVSSSEKEGMMHQILERLERTSSQTGFRIQDTKKQKSNNEATKSNQNVKSRGKLVFRQLTSPAGCKVLVGRNQHENEAIAFQIARGDDVWMHARGCPGAHVLLQVRRGSPLPTDDCLQYAANLAVFYSHARTERKAPVTTANPKHILKPKGASFGAVKLRMEGITLIGISQNVPDELKTARAESGGAWGTADEEGGLLSLRGKNRKKTREVTKSNQAKKRAEKRTKKKRRIRSDYDNTGSSLLE